jgi:hypothetical protein
MRIPYSIAMSTTILIAFVVGTYAQTTDSQSPGTATPTDMQSSGTVSPTDTGSPQVLTVDPECSACPDALHGTALENGYPLRDGHTLCVYDDKKSYTSCVFNVSIPSLDNR